MGGRTILRKECVPKSSAVNGKNCKGPLSDLTKVEEVHTGYKDSSFLSLCILTSACISSIEHSPYIS